MSIVWLGDVDRITALSSRAIIMLRNARHETRCISVYMLDCTFHRYEFKGRDYLM